MKDIQLRNNREFVLPEAVYRQVIWILRDYDRMNIKLLEMREDAYSPQGVDISRTLVRNMGLQVSDITGNSAIHLMNLENKIDAIDRAFLIIPDKYREGVFNKLIYDVPFSNEFHINTWRKWQQIVIYQIAVSLELL